MRFDITPSMDLIGSKIFAIVTLGAASLLVGLLPACFANQGRQQWPLFLSTLLCFGGGVLLATSMVHILPELRETFPQEYREYAELVFCLGFFLLYALDEIVHFFYGDAHQIVVSGEHHHRSTRFRDHQDVRRYSSTSSKSMYGATESDPLTARARQQPYNPTFYRAHSDSVLYQDEPPSQLCHVGHQEPCKAAPSASNLGLLVALSIHALLEGLVVGLEESPSKVLLLLGAIASHKLVVGFCLGIEIASNSAQTFCRQFVYILIFSMGSSGGILIGMFISNVHLEGLTIPILQGLAGGTLLYVTVSEVLPRERARWHQQTSKRAAGVMQFASVFIGFVLMTVFTKYLNA